MKTCFETKMKNCQLPKIFCKHTTRRHHQYTWLENTTPTTSTVTPTPFSNSLRSKLAEMILGSVKPTVGELVRADAKLLMTLLICLGLRWQ